MKKIIFVVTMFVMMACHKESDKKVESVALPVEVSTPAIRDVRLTREYPGYLTADAAIPVMGRVNGTIIKRNFTEGGRVKQGDLLFVIEPILYENAVTQATATLQTAQAEYDYALNSYERMNKAISSDAVSRIELLQAKSKVESCRAAIDNASAALSTAKTRLGYCYVKAPTTGVIGLRQFSVGTFVSGEMSPVELCKIYKDDIMYAYFNISDEQWLRSVQRGGSDIDQSNITFSLGGDNYLTWDAKIDYLAPDVNLTTGTLQVRAELSNEDGMLKPGSYIKVLLPYEEIKNAVLVRDASIGTDQLGKYLYVVNDSNMVEYRRVTVGNLVDDTLRLVTDGLEADERYVTKALLKVRNGINVVPIMEK